MTIVQTILNLTVDVTELIVLDREQVGFLHLTTFLVLCRSESFDMAVVLPLGLILQRVEVAVDDSSQLVLNFGIRAIVEEGDGVAKLEPGDLTSKPELRDFFR